MVATLSPLPLQQYVDQNGVPLAGGWLYTYIAGTSTPQPTYTDASGGSANPNPTPLDSAGRAAIWLGNNAYKLALKDANFNPIWTSDNVQSPSAQVLGALATAGSSTGSALVGFIQDGAGAGAVARTSQDKLREIVSVKDFGAKGDGVTDDTAAIQTAINYAATFGSGFGGEVVFPTGQYRYTTITISNSGVSLRGEGKAALVKTTAAGNGLLVIGPSGRIYGINISNLSFSAGVTQTSGAAIYMTNTGQCKLDNVTFTNFPFANWRGFQSNNVSQITMTAMVSQNCVDSGFVVTDMIDLYVSSSRSDANGLHGWFFDTCSGVYFADVTAFSNNGAGFFMQHVAAGVIAQSNNFYFMTACVADTNGSNNWTMNDLTQSELTACWASSQKNTSTNLNGFALNGGCANIELNGCLAFTNNNAGLLALNGATDIVVRGGQYISNGRVAGSSQKHGIWMDATSYQILGARCQNLPLTPSQVYGVFINSGTTAMVKDCDLLGNLTGGINVATYPTNFIERDNIVGPTVVNISSAATLPVPFTGEIFFVTGTTNITAISNAFGARKISLIFLSALTVTDGGTLKLAGNLTTGTGTTLTLVSEGTNWYEISRSVN